jgi:hypothetical protein
MCEAYHSLKLSVFNASMRLWLQFSFCWRFVPSWHTLHTTSWSPALLALIRQFEHIECPQRSTMGFFLAKSNAPLQHRQVISSTCCGAAEIKNGIEMEATDCDWSRDIDVIWLLKVRGGMWSGKCEGCEAPARRIRERPDVSATK